MVEPTCGTIILLRSTLITSAQYIPDLGGSHRSTRTAIDNEAPPKARCLGPMLRLDSGQSSARVFRVLVEQKWACFMNSNLNPIAMLNILEIQNGLSSQEGRLSIMFLSGKLRSCNFIRSTGNYFDP